MRTVEAGEIVKRVKDACMSANFELGEDVVEALRKAKEKEVSPVGKEILELLFKNTEIAKEEKVALCQDTGFAVCFVELGDEVRIEVARANLAKRQMDFVLAEEPE